MSTWWRFCNIPPTTISPAVLARPRISSSGSSGEYSPSDRRTLTRIAFSWRSERSVLLVSIKVGVSLEEVGDGENGPDDPNRILGPPAGRRQRIANRAPVPPDTV